MDIIKFNNPSTVTVLPGGVVVDDTVMQKAEIINNIKTKMWIERFRPAGEFTLTASADSDLREKLPIGSFISHTNTLEIMIVEDHQISAAKGTDPELIVTGRGLEAFFDNRMIGIEGYGDFDTYIENHPKYFNANFSWEQAKVLLLEAIRYEWMVDDNFALAGIQVLTSVTYAGTSVERWMDLKSTYESVIELLAVDNNGIKVVRPNILSPAVPTTDTAIIIHEGIDRTAEVMFSYDIGEIDNAEYLWSNRASKNCAMVVSKWFIVLVNPAETGYNRRTIMVDAKDIDQDYSELPLEPDRTNIINAMNQRGVDFLSSQREVVITKAEISRDSSQHRYRSDYNLGDLVTVSGDYNAVSTMRVTEYVETEDETGESGYPTLIME